MSKLKALLRKRNTIQDELSRRKAVLDHVESGLSALGYASLDEAEAAVRKMKQQHSRLSELYKKQEKRARKLLDVAERALNDESSQS